MKEQVFNIDESGEILTLHSDDLNLLGGKRKTTRASNVEPSEDGTWEVRLAVDPIFGKFSGKLIGVGFSTRAEAIEFEIKWINDNILGGK